MPHSVSRSRKNRFHERMLRWFSNSLRKSRKHEMRNLRLSNCQNEVALWEPEKWRFKQRFIICLLYRVVKLFKSVLMLRELSQGGTKVFLSIELHSVNIKNALCLFKKLNSIMRQMKIFLMRVGAYKWKQQANIFLEYQFSLLWFSTTGERSEKCLLSNMLRVLRLLTNYCEKIFHN